MRKVDRDDEILAIDELSQLVLSGIAEKQTNIFDQTKRSMKKYLGSTKTRLSIKGNSCIKEETSHIIVEEVMYLLVREVEAEGETVDEDPS